MSENEFLPLAAFGDMTAEFNNINNVRTNLDVEYLVPEPGALSLLSLGSWPCSVSFAETEPE